MRFSAYYKDKNKKQKLRLQSVARKKDVFEILPTGFGKRLIFLNFLTAVSYFERGMESTCRTIGCL